MEEVVKRLLPRSDRRLRYQFVYDEKDRFGFIIWPWGNDHPGLSESRIAALRIHIGTPTGMQWLPSRYLWPAGMPLISPGSTEEFVFAMNIALEVGELLDKEKEID